MPESFTTAILAGSFCWDHDAVESVRPFYVRESVADEAMAWQHLSHEGADAEEYAYPSPFRRQVTFNGVTHVIEPRQGTAPRDPNRIVEIHGLMGAIGEQLGLAWTAEQDVQRLMQTRSGRDGTHHRLVARAQAELAGYFVLGAAHSLANLVLRVLLLNADAAAALARAFERANGFPAGSDDRDAWPTLNDRLLSALRRAASASANSAMSRAVDFVESFDKGDALRALDARRGMDYHRRRPQSVPHASPRRGTMSQTPGGSVILGGLQPVLEPEADEDALHGIVVAAMLSTGHTMLDIRTIIPVAIRNEGINYVHGSASS